MKKNKAPKFPVFKTRHGYTSNRLSVIDVSGYELKFETLTLKHRVRILIWAISTNWWLCNNGENSK